MSYNKINLSYKTKHELDYVSRIGTFCEPERCKLTRIELLRRYIASANKRRYWDGIDAKRVIRFAEAELEKAISHSLRR